MNSTRKKVLVLSSDPDFLISLEHVLEGEGFDTTTTWDAREAFSLVADRHFDAVLVGEHPPEVKSIELLKGMQANRRRMVFIVLASDARHPFEAEYLCALGAHAVIPRWKQKRIVDTVRQSTGGIHAAGEWASATA